MPEFIPQHVPTDLDEFVQGYLAAAEWLAPKFGESGDSDEDESWPRGEDGEPLEGSNGWSEDALARATADCTSFVAANADDLALYVEHSGRDMSSAGHDFWLTRNGHGAGFWDRDYSGRDDIGERLSAAAHGYEELYLYVDAHDFLCME